MTTLTLAKEAEQKTPEISKPLSVNKRFYGMKSKIEEKANSLRSVVHSLGFKEENAEVDALRVELLEVGKQAANAIGIDPSDNVIAREANSELNEQSSHVKKEDIVGRPKVLSQEELMQMAKKDFAVDIESGWVSSGRVEEFIKERVMGAKINGVNVISIDFEHSKTEQGTMLRRYIESPNTRVVVAEYFYPELEKNAGRLLPLMKSMEDKKFGDFGDRLKHAHEFANLCQKADKVVAVADIANKARYQVNAMLLRCSPIIASLALGLSGGIGTEVFNYLSPAFLLASAGSSIRNNMKMGAGKGLYDKHKIGKEEQILFNTEDARRYFIAKGVEKLTKAYPPISGEDKPQIVMLYPRAHGIRILNHLVNPGQLGYKVKAPVYRTLGHGLDFSVRTWQYGNGIQKLVNSGYKWGDGEKGVPPVRKNKCLEENNLAGWNLIREESLPLL